MIVVVSWVVVSLVCGALWSFAGVVIRLLDRRRSRAFFAKLNQPVARRRAPVVDLTQYRRREQLDAIARMGRR